MLSTPLRDGWTLDPKRLPLVAVAEDVGLPPDDYSCWFLTGRGGFHVAGIDPRQPKYQISVTRPPDGKGDKFPAQDAALLLKAARWDVSPGA